MFKPVPCGALATEHKLTGLVELGRHDDISRVSRCVVDLRWMCCEGRMSKGKRSIISVTKS